MLGKGATEERGQLRVRRALAIRRDEIGHERRSALELPTPMATLACDGRMRVQYRRHLARLHPEAPDAQLVVHAPEELDLPVGAQPHAVAGAVSPSARALEEALAA